MLPEDLELLDRDDPYDLDELLPELDLTEPDERVLLVDLTEPDLDERVPGLVTLVFDLFVLVVPTLLPDRVVDDLPLTRVLLVFRDVTALVSLLVE